LGYAVTLEFDEYNKLTFANDYNKALIHIETNEAGEREVDPFYKALFTAWQPIDVRTTAQNNPEEEIRTLNAFQQMTIGAGLEYWYRDLFALRTGYFYENPYNGNRKFLTFGSGIRWNIIGVDFSYIYALEENHPLSNTMRFSLLLNFLK